MPKFDPAKVRALFKDGESGGTDTKPALKIEVGKTYLCRNGNKPTITATKQVKGRTVFVAVHLIMKDGKKYALGNWHYHEDGKNAGRDGDYRTDDALPDDIIEELFAEGEAKQWILGKLKLEVGKKYRRLDGQVVTALCRVDATHVRVAAGPDEEGSAASDKPRSWAYTPDGAWHSEADNPVYHRHLIECVEDTTPKPEDTVPEAKPAGKLDSALAALRDALGGGADPETVRRIVNEELDKRPARVISIEIPKLDIKETVEHAHPKFPDLCALIANNQRVFIAGPAGSGKTTAVEEAAKLLKRPFFVQPPVADKFELLGFVDAAGNYQDTPMYHWATTENAILLLDEVDGSFPQPLLALNMALANGYAVFPKHGKVPIHANNAVACTANTWGGGADFDYVGRAKLDAAFLNRFPAKLCWDYDEDFELELAKAQAAATKPLVKVIQRIRENARKHGIKIPVTPRDTLFYCRMRAAGWSHDKTLDSGVLSTCKADQRAKLLEGVKAP